LVAGAEQVRIISTAVDGTDGSEQSFIVTTPVDWSGSRRPPAQRGPMVLSLADASWSATQAEDMINLHSFEIDWGAEEAISLLTQIPVSDYNSFACAETGRQFQCIPQMDGAALDGLPEIIPFQPHYRNFGSEEAMVFNFITDVGDGNGGIRAGIRWVELRRNEVDDWRLYQEGTYAPDDDLHRFMGSIALDEDGNIGLAYSTSSANSYVGLRYTGRNAGDPLGMMTFDEEIAVQGTNSINSPFGISRYGDYPHMTVDPIDGRTFWFTSEYATNNTSTSRIIAFKASRPPYDLSAVSINNPVSASNLSNNEVLQLTVKNLGATAISNYEVGYQVKDGPIVIEEINSNLDPDQTFTYNFMTTLDLSEIGTYPIKVFTSSDLDVVNANDTLNTVIVHYPITDATVNNITTTTQAVCGTTTDVSFILENLGTALLENVDVEILLNGTSVRSYKYDTNLDFGSKTSITNTIDGFVDGDNQLIVRTSSPNGLQDQNTNNDEVVQTINVIADGEIITVDFLTDFYQNESRWTITDPAGNLIEELNDIPGELAEMHVYTDVCLRKDSCYIFDIFDSASDGLTSFDRDDGSYQILRNDSTVLASILEADFGSRETNFFCLNDDCQLQAEYSTTGSTTSAGDGTILVQVTNGRGPNFQYSIDGGTTFSDSNLFGNLTKGEYTVIIRDNFGCELSQLVIIDGVDAVRQISKDVTVTLYPNPTSGVFQVELKGYNSTAISMPVDIVDATGAVIQRTGIYKYSDTYKGMISLHHYSAGQYYVKIELPDGPHLIKIKKK